MSLERRLDRRKRIEKDKIEDIKGDIGVDRETSDIILSRLVKAGEVVDSREFHEGINVELEHSGTIKGDPLKTGQIALDHLREFPDYYTRLGKMENEGEEAFKKKGNRFSKLFKRDVVDESYEEKVKDYFEGTGTYSEGEFEEVE